MLIIYTKSDDFAPTVAKTEFIDVTATGHVIFGARMGGRASILYPMKGREGNR
jgi:hypothetical protein